LTAGAGERPANAPAPFAIPERMELIVKVAERCNLACTYCYFFFHKDRSYESHPALITEDSVNGLCDFASSAALSGVKTIAIVFHGGEPLLLKPQRFDALCEALSAALEGLCNYSFSVQTNATLIDETWVDLFAKWRMSVGVSLDGDEARNDAYRIDHQGRGSYQNALKGLRLLQGAAAEGRIGNPGLLSVVDPEGSGAAAYRHFVDELGFRRLSFLLLDETHDTITPKIVKGTEDFMLGVFQEWTRDDRKDITVRFFSELIACLCSDEEMKHFAPYREDMSNVFTVSSAGDVGMDDVIRSLGGRFAEHRFNLFDHRLETVVQSDLYREIRTAIHAHRPAACAACDWWKLCRGGRVNTRFDEASGFERETVYCSALKNIYSRVVSYLLDNGIDGDDILRRLS